MKGRTIIPELYVMQVRRRPQRTFCLGRSARANYQRPSTSPSTRICKKFALVLEIQNLEPRIKYHGQGLCIRLFPWREVASWSDQMLFSLVVDIYRRPYGLLSCGLSFNTVLMPTRIPSCIVRILTCARLNRGSKRL